MQDQSDKEAPRVAQNAAALGRAAESDPPPPKKSDSLMYRLSGAVLTLRPHQWVKNVFVLAPIVFAKEMFAADTLLRAGSAFAVFCLLAGAVYAMNDVADVAQDREHPVKRFRPVASGRLPLGWARGLSVGLIVVALAASLGLGLGFLVAAAAYFALNVAYSLKLKHVAYVDVACISGGFVLRVLAGGLATGIEVSGYLFVCTALLSLFLGFGKRRHELDAAAKKAGQQRAALESYSRGGLDIALAITATLTIATYLTYTLDARTRAFFNSDFLWPSTAFVVLGVWRFLVIARTRPHAESPTQEMLRDGPFVGIVLLWVALVLWVVYHLRPG